MSPTRLLCQGTTSDAPGSTPGSGPENADGNEDQDSDVHVNLHFMHRDPLTSPSTAKKPPTTRNWKLKSDLAEPADSDVKRKLFHDPEGGESEEEKENDPVVDKPENESAESEKDMNEEDDNKREASKGTLKD